MGAEALEFLFREVRVCEWHGEGGKGSESAVYCSSAGLEDTGGIQSDLPLNRCLGGVTYF